MQLKPNKKTFQTMLLSPLQSPDVNESLVVITKLVLRYLDIMATIFQKVREFFICSLK